VSCSLNCLLNSFGGGSLLQTEPDKPCTVPVGTGDDPVSPQPPELPAGAETIACSKLPQPGRSVTQPELCRLLRAAQQAGPLHDHMRILTDDELEKPIGCEPVPETEQSALAPEAWQIPGYRLLRRVATGGQASIYEAVQERTRRRVALKILSAISTSASREARFEREADILARLNHPGIVRIVDRGRISARGSFLAMDFVDGQDLDEHVRSVRQLEGVDTTRTVLRLFIEIGEALAAAHDQGVLHRDLKPANVRVHASQHPRILDFGLARLFGPSNQGESDLTCTGELVGSLAWLSPEQIQRETDEIDERSDIYAFGLLLYSCMAGFMPYRTTGPASLVMKAITTEEPRPFPVTCVSATDRGLRVVLTKALQKDRACRYQTMHAFIADLRALVSGGFPANAAGSRSSLLTPKLLIVPVLLIAGLTAYWAQPVARPTLEMPQEKTSIGLKLVRLNGVTDFYIGSPDGESGRRRDERQAQVTVAHPFWISTTEVTRQQFHSLMQDLADPPGPSERDLPVSSVTWDEAVEFCRRLSQREGHEYRLPTEAEWELACRAGTAGPFSDTLADVGWFLGNSGGTVRLVGQRQPNVWGLYDMHGNVAEWCHNDYVPTYLSSEPWPNAKAIRGGSFADPADRCRAASRDVLHTWSHSPRIGFRVVRAPAADPALLSVPAE
jgi:eukaryotic-like serine/threonine-protein kinase